MVTVTLDDRDRAMLERLREGATDEAALAEHADCDLEYVRDRLPELADNGLVHRADGAYALTADGERVLAASPAGTADDRIDTPEAVDERIRSFDLLPDREEAILNAFAFLRYWGAASASEIVDAVYSENPAGYGSRADWWEECVRERLADLPRVEPPEASDGEWRYAGTPTVDRRTDDGRLPAGDTGGQSSVKFAIERSPLSEGERAAVRAAFDRLADEGEVTTAELRARVYPDHDAGYDSPDEWWDECVREAFESLPGVEPDDDGGDRWRYRQTAEGPASSEPGAEPPDESVASPDDEDG